jgi:hypothetical protein
MAASNGLVYRSEMWCDLRSMTDGGKRKCGKERCSYFILSILEFFESEARISRRESHGNSLSLLLCIVGFLPTRTTLESIVRLSIHVHIYIQVGACLHVYVHVFMYTTCLRYEVSCLSKFMYDLNYDSLQSDRLITFQRNILPPSSGQK